MKRFTFAHNVYDEFFIYKVLEFHSSNGNEQKIMQKKCRKIEQRSLTDNAT